MVDYVDEKFIYLLKKSSLVLKMAKSIVIKLRTTLCVNAPYIICAFLSIICIEIIATHREGTLFWADFGSSCDF